MKYNGYENYETWNVALWIINDEGLYNMAKGYRRSSTPYESFISDLREIGIVETPDQVAWNDTGIDVETLDNIIKEL